PGGNGRNFDRYRPILGFLGVPPGSGRSAYRSPIGPVRTARTGRYDSVSQSLVYSTYTNLKKVLQQCVG
ncbi:unnamed protein product, partial [Musa acuminata subsp. burmannicoides]